MPPQDSIILDLPGFKIIEVLGINTLTLRVEYEGKINCTHCSCQRVRIKASSFAVTHLKFLILGLMNLTRAKFEILFFEPVTNGSELSSGFLVFWALH